jgi:MarR family
MVASMSRKPHKKVSRAGRRNKREWVWIFQRPWGTLAQNAALTLQHWRVLAYLLSRMEFREALPVMQADIAEFLHLPQSNVSRALAMLVEQGVVVRHQIGCQAVYSLSTTYAYKGHGAWLPSRTALQRTRAASSKTPDGKKSGSKSSSATTGDAKTAAVPQ